MKRTTAGIFAFFAMAVTGGGVYAVTPDGGFGRPPTASVGEGASAPAERSSAGGLANATPPTKRTEFASGDVLRLEGRVAHASLLGDSARETFMLLEVRGESRSGGERPQVNLSIVIDKSGSMIGSRIANARAAAVGAVERLREGDTVSVVAFDTKPEVVVPTTSVVSTSRFGITESIRRIQLGGDTCISCGLDAGMKELRSTALQGDGKSSVMRMLLLSDGQPTSGVSDVNGFRSIGERASSEGVSITTVGVDLAYNEEVMTAIAVASNGGHHFVESGADLVTVFEKETASLAESVAAGAVADLDLAPGVELVQLFDRPFTRSGSRISVPLGDFAKGDVKTVLAKVRLGASDLGPRDLMKARVVFRDLSKQADASVTGALGLELDSDVGKAREIDAVVLDRIQRSETTAALQEANSLITLGKTDLALKRLDEAERSLSAARERAKRTAPQGRAEAIDKSFSAQDENLKDAQKGFAAPPNPSKPDTQKREKTKKQNAAKFRPQMI